ncbi:MAG TPA: four helix bundle protein [Chitinophagaceae bacterium]|nr:four helix bundle protein [Chitinophagaceae bacterium]
MGDYRDLIVFQKSYKLAMDIFGATKKFPAEERYSLTDQLRRSSRSVCANLVEAYRRRKYRPYFISKLTDSETENAETQVWLDFAKIVNTWKLHNTMILLSVMRKLVK